MHQLDKTTVDTTLVANPNQFALLAVQVEEPADRREKHRTDPQPEEGR
ncbi:hypothetical protein OG894_43230 (plasmid) [Streptomyces sp. NBC_01724]|nr:hypothetical protein [Streptomyces sp. NBC_01724]